MRKLARGALAVGVVLGLGASVAGCGPLLTAGIVAGVDSASGGGSGGAANNGQTTVTAAAATGDTNGGTATIEFSVQDPEGDQVTVEVRYSTDPNASASALFSQVATGTYTDASGNPVTPPLTAAAAGTTYRFLWNTAQDLGTSLNQGTVRTQLVIGGELAFTTAFFSVDNTSSPMISVVNLPSLPTGATVFADRQNTNSIPLQVTVLDADSQAARVDVLFSTDGGATFPATNVAVGTFTDSTNTIQDPTALPTTSGGLTYTFAWSSSLNGVDTGSNVVLRFTARDSKTGAPRDSTAFAVNNADFSALIETPGPSAAVDRVPVEFTLIDESGGSLDVTLEYSVNGPGGPFSPCSEALQPPNEGSQALASPVSPGQEHAILWNSFADFRGVGAFTASNVVLRLTPRRRETQVAGAPVLSGVFSVDQRLLRTVFNEGVDFSSNTLATAVELPPMADVAASPQFTLLGPGEAGFMAEISQPAGTLAEVEINDGFSDVFRVALDSNNNRFTLDRSFSFGAASQDITLRRIDRTTGIGSVLMTEVGVPFVNPPDDPGPNASLAVVGTQVVTSYHTSGLGHVLRRVGTLGGAVESLSFGGVVQVGAGSVPVNSNAQVTGIAAHPSNANLLIVGLQGDNQGVYRSTNRGDTWTRVYTGPIVSLVSDFGALPNRTIMAGEAGVGIQVSLNNGGAWALRNGALPNPGNVSRLLFTTGTTYLAGFAGQGGNGQVWATTDAGLNWNEVATGTLPVGADVRDLLLDGTTLYAATNMGVYRSLSGAAWTALPGLPSQDVRALAQDSANFLFAATAGGVAVFDNPGWTQQNTGLTTLDAISIVGDPANAGQLFVGTRDGGMFSTTDGGDNWQFAAGGLSDPAVTEIALDSSNGTYVGTANAGVFDLTGTSFVARPGTPTVGDLIVTSAQLRIAHLSPGPVADTFIYCDPAGNQIVAINLSSATVTITNVMIPARRAMRIAGNGSATGNTTSGAVAATSSFPSPLGVVCDPATGEVYFSEPTRNRVWQVNAAGIATVVAGRLGPAGFSGDGGLGTNALLDFPTAVDLSGDGALFVVDAGNSRVRQVRMGTISTAAGTAPAVNDGFQGPAAVLSAPSAASVTSAGVVIADSGQDRVRLVTTATGLISTIAGQGASGSAGDGGQATAAEVGAPQDFVVAPDTSLWIAQQTGRIRRIRTDGVIETIVGRDTIGNGGGLGLEGGTLLGTSMRSSTRGPSGIALRNDALLIADSGNSKVWAANLSAAAQTVGGIVVPPGEVRRVAGDENGGVETQAQARTLDDVVDVAWLSNGDWLFLERGRDTLAGTEEGAGRLYRVDNTNGNVTFVAGIQGAVPDTNEEVSPPTNALLSYPSGLHLVSDTLYVVVESGRHVLRAINVGGAPVTLHNVTIPANSAKVIAGTLGTSGTAGDGGAGLLGRFTLSDVNNEIFPNAVGLLTDAGGNLLFPDPGSNRIRGLNANGNLFTFAGGGILDGDGRGAGVATMSQPLALTTVPGTGAYAVFDGGRVRRVDLGTTVVSTAAGTGAEVTLDSGALPPRVSALVGTGFNFVRDLVFPDNDLFSGTSTAGGNVVTLDDPLNGFAGAYPGMVVEEIDTANNNTVLRTGVITGLFPGSTDAVPVSRSEDLQTWNNKTYRINDAFDLAGPRGISAATVNGASLLAIADTRNHAVFLANTGTVAFVCSGYPAEPGGTLTIGPNQIARVAGDGSYVSGFPTLPPAETVAEQVRLGFPVGVQLLPSGLLVIGDTLYGGNGRVVVLNLGAAPVDLAGASGIPPGGARTIVPVGTARRPLSVAVTGNDLVWSEHGLPSNPTLNMLPRVRYQAHVAGTAYGVATLAGTPVNVLGGLAPFANGVALRAARGIAIDSGGTLFVVDTGEEAVFGVNPSGGAFVLAGSPGNFTVIGDGEGGLEGDLGPGSSARLRAPYGVATDDSSRAVLILDVFNFRVRRVRRFP